MRKKLCVLLAIAVCLLAGCQYFHDNSKPEVTGTNPSTETIITSTTETKTVSTTAVNDTTTSITQQTTTESTLNQNGYSFSSTANQGSFQTPHKIGEQVQIAYTTPWGNKVDADISVKEVIRGENAMQWLREHDISTEDEYLDISSETLILVSVKLEIQATNPDWALMLGACNSSGEIISEYGPGPTFLTGEDVGLVQTTPGIYEGWSAIVVPARTDYTLAYFVGDPLEHPGIVATFYFATE